MKPVIWFMKCIQEILIDLCMIVICILITLSPKFEEALIDTIEGIEAEGKDEW